jgi:hypothetical protein
MRPKDKHLICWAEVEFLLVRWAARVDQEQRHLTSAADCCTRNRFDHANGLPEDTVGKTPLPLASANPDSVHQSMHDPLQGEAHQALL